jgi:hypothetical protein
VEAIERFFSGIIDMWDGIGDPIRLSDVREDISPSKLLITVCCALSLCAGIVGIALSYTVPALIPLLSPSSFFALSCLLIVVGFVGLVLKARLCMPPPMTDPMASADIPDEYRRFLPS